MRLLANAVALEHLGHWRWRATLGSWEEHGMTRRAALRRLRLRYDLSTYVVGTPRRFR